MNSLWTIAWPQQSKAQQNRVHISWDILYDDPHPALYIDKEGTNTLLINRMTTPYGLISV